MSIDMEQEYDFGDAKRATQIPHLNRLRQQQANEQKLLDDDVQNWLANQNTATKSHISQMIRQVMAITQVAH